jgi:type IV pilus assembly protein PilY1
MKPNFLRTFFLLGSLIFGSQPALGEDIDIYAGTGANAALPNVLFVFDNAAGFNANFPDTCTYPDGGTPSLSGKAAGIQQCALVHAISAIPDSTVNMGIMVYNESQMTGSPVILAGTGATTNLNCNNVNEGGCLVQPLAEMTPAAKQRMIDFIKSWKASGTSIAGAFNIVANSQKTGSVMQEAWAYYRGTTGVSGIDYAGIQPAAGCQQNYVIFIGNAVGTAGTPGDPGTANLDVLLQNRPDVTTTQLEPISLTYAAGETCNTGPSFYSMPNHTSVSGLWADEWARYMKGSDLYPDIEDQQGITTYTIGVLDPATCKADFPAVLTSMATVGGGEYFPTTSFDALRDAIATILNKIQAVNSAFASASLPITVNPQGNFLNQIFVGQFRPDPDGKPRWMGNLKQYQFGVDTTDPDDLKLFLADADGNRAIAGAVAGEEQSGFISIEARSFWTSKNTATLPDNIGGFWRNNPQGFAAGFDSPDGNIVEKGGVGEQIRRENIDVDYTTSPAAPRRLYTCIGTDCDSGELLSNMPFATTNTNLTSSVLGITNPVHTATISTISRNSGTGIVTVNLAAAPSPNMTDPTTASISGSTGAQFDYPLSAASPTHTVGSTVLTYTLPSETPPVTPAAGYTAAKVGGGSVAFTGVSSIMRSSGAGRITVTATLDDLTFGGGSTLVTGELINISSSTGYNGSGYTVTNVDTVSRNVTYSMSDSPTVYGGGGQIWVGASCVTTGNSKNCDSLGASNTNAPGTSPIPGLVRGVNTSLSTTSHILMVNFPSGTNVSFNVGNTAKIQTATPSEYNNATTGYEIVATGTSCSVTVIDPTSGSTRLYTGTLDTVAKKFSLCLKLGDTFGITPALSANGATVGTTQASRASPGASKDIISMSRNASNCPSSNLATVTAQTSSAHGLVALDKVIIGNPTPGANEAAYNGTFEVVSAPTSDTFTFQVSTAPACTASGGTLSYQDTAGGVSANDLIRWVRGANNIGDEKSTGGGVTVRPSIHGDVLHSRPTVIGYPNGDIVVFYGSNDGVFRAINGSNKEDGTGAINGVLPGQELWSFIPQEFYSKLQRLYFNTPIVKLHNTNLTLFPDAKAKDYFFDGSIGVYQDNATSTAHIYLSARRGGRIIYALDVSNPAAPKFMWKKGCPNLTDNVGCDSGFEELGQTWSLPRVAFINGHSNPVLIFGAGYDPAEDAEPQPVAASRVMGRGIFVLDALDGTLLWKAGPSASSTSNTCTMGAGTTCELQDMTYAIPSDVTLVDRTGASGAPDGFIDRIYVGDLGGNVWRVDLEPAAGNTPADWRVTKLASLGGASTDTTKRKIFFPPDVVLTKNFDAVLVGTGDREHPVYSNTNALSIVNRFYMLKDTTIGSDACPLVGGVPTCAATITDNTSSTADVQPASPTSSNLFKAGTVDANGDPIPYDNSGSGFYITLKNGTEVGEKAVNAPTTIGGNTFFGTNTPIAPDPNVCQANLGIARGYNVNVVTGVTSFVTFDGGGLPPSPVSGLVAVNVGGQEKLIPFLIGGGNPNPDCIGPDCTSALGGLKPPIPIKAIRSRTYWYREHDKQ